MNQSVELASKANQKELEAANAKIQKLESENTDLKMRLEKIERVLDLRSDPSQK